MSLVELKKTGSVCAERLSAEPSDQSTMAAAHWSGRKIAGPEVEEVGNGPLPMLIYICKERLTAQGLLENLPLPISG